MDNKELRKKLEKEYRQRTEAAIGSLNSEEAAELKALSAQRERRQEDYSRDVNTLTTARERERLARHEAQALSGLSAGGRLQAELQGRGDFLSRLSALQGQFSRAEEQGRLSQQETRGRYSRLRLEQQEKGRRELGEAIAHESEKRYRSALEKARTLARFGDFSLYEKLYGADKARQMQQVWISENPRSAYSLGLISAEDYRRLTGKYPPG